LYNYIKYFHVKEINEGRGIMTVQTNKWHWKRITENEEKESLESLYNITRIFPLNSLGCYISANHKG